MGYPDTVDPEYRQYFVAVDHAETQLSNADFKPAVIPISPNNRLQLYVEKVSSYIGAVNPLFVEFNYLV